MDFALNWDGLESSADLIVSGGGFVGEAGLYTALALSLFLDRRADDDDELPTGSTAFGEADRRGWWGNDVLADEGDEYGSRLWLYRRSSLTEGVLEDLQRACEEALEWFVDSGIAASVDVVVSVGAPGRADIRITITRQSDLPIQYTFVWDALEGLRSG